MQPSNPLTSDELAATLTLLLDGMDDNEIITALTRMLSRHDRVRALLFNLERHTASASVGWVTRANVMTILWEERLDYTGTPERFISELHRFIDSYYDDDLSMQIQHIHQVFVHHLRALRLVGPIHGR